MTTYISILRGINVNGKKLIKMDALQKMCTNLKFENVHTYIQSGNIIYNYKKANAFKISELIKKAIEKTFGFDVPVITMALIEFEKTIYTNPFLKIKTMDAAFFHVTFLSAIPSNEHLELLNQQGINNDQYVHTNQTIYLYCPYGYSKTKLTNNFLESKLKVTATTRNWKTCNEVIKIAQNLKVD